MAKPTDTLSELIGRIYAAVESPAEWGTFLERLRLAMGATGALILHYDTSAPALAVQAFAGFDADAISQYHGHYRQTDPWSCALKRADCLPGRVFDGLELIADDEVRRGEYYNDFGRRVGSLRAAFGALEPMGTRIGFFSVNRGERQPPFGAEDMRLLKELTPHLRQAFRLQRRLALADESRAMSCGALDALPIAVVLLNGSADIVYLNQAARELIARRDGLVVEGRQLRGATSVDSHRLSAAVRAAAGAPGISVSDRDLAFALRRPSYNAPLRVVVIPTGALPSRTNVAEEATASVAVFVSDPERDTIESPERLTRLFGFTPAESRVTCLLAGGKTVRDIAAILSVSSSTVRWHVKQALHKAGVRNQAQLVSLVLRGPAALRGVHRV